VNQRCILSTGSPRPWVCSLMKGRAHKHTVAKNKKRVQGKERESNAYKLITKHNARSLAPRCRSHRKNPEAQRVTVTSHTPRLNHLPMRRERERMLRKCPCSRPDVHGGWNTRRGSRIQGIMGWQTPLPDQMECPCSLHLRGHPQPSAGLHQRAAHTWLKNKPQHPAKKSGKLKGRTRVLPLARNSCGSATGSR
jgi:hypothetical protein